MTENKGCKTIKEAFNDFNLEDNGFDNNKKYKKNIKVYLKTKKEFHPNIN